MLRKTIVAMGLLLGSIVSVQAADLKIGVVDTKLVLSKAPQMKAVSDRIQAKFKERQNALVAMQKKGEELRAKAQRDQSILTRAQAMEIGRQLQTLDSEFTIKQKFLQEDIKIESGIEQQKVAKKVKDAINKIAKDEKFDLIMASDVVIHAVPALDITDRIIAIISNPAG